MQRAITVSDIRRQGLGVADQDLVFGPVMITRNYQPVYVLMTAEQFQTLAGEHIAGQTALVRGMLEDIVAGELTPETARQMLDELRRADLEHGEAGRWSDASSAAPASIHQLKLTLTGIKPPIWRRIQVDSDINLRRLHDVVQVVMGWEQAHLYEFKVGRTSVGEPETMFEDTASAVDYTLRQVAPQAAAKLGYLYDFGDSWEHQIVVEKVLEPEDGVTYPRCIEGRRAGPPEDSGGVWGYERMLAILQDPEDPEYWDILDWTGEDGIDPEVFDIDAVNGELANLGPGPWEYEGGPIL